MKPTINDESIIEVRELTKSFKIPKKVSENSKLKIIRNFLFRQTENKKAVDSISFSIKKGEIVGLIGVNGSGKSTTIKILSGILSPSFGTVKILKFDPFKDRSTYTYHIGTIFGGKSSLWYNIPVIESLKVFRDIYGVSEEQYNQRLNYFSQNLALDEILHIPVRQLSLGQKMRAEIAASCLHNPDIIFLDEPTIGLDLLAKSGLIKYLDEINKQYHTTILFTTHDLNDVEQICERIIIIDKVKNIYDVTIDYLKKLNIQKNIDIRFKKEVTNELDFLLEYDNLSIIEKTPYYLKLKSDKNTNLSDLIKKIIFLPFISDIEINSPKLEEIIREIYQKGF